MILHLVIHALPVPWDFCAAEAESPQASQEESAGGVEYMLLVALESLYTGNAERDVQLGVLRTLLNVLQVCSTWAGAGATLIPGNPSNGC